MSFIQHPPDISSQWHVVAASVRGKHHEKTGQPCQDANQWRALPGKVLVAAIADGAGSAGLADVGASLATRCAVESLQQKGAELILKTSESEWRGLYLEVLKFARSAVETEAASRKVALRDLATTLILAVATPQLVAAAQIGDGAVVIADRISGLTAITKPCVSEYLNETTFLTSADALEKVQFIVHASGPAHLAMLTDGLQMLALKMPEGTPHSPFFNPLLRLVQADMSPGAGEKQLAAFLSSPRVGERTDDDLTLLLASNL